MIRGFFFFISLWMITIGNAQQSTASINVSTFTIEAPQLKTTKKIWIYLPEGYSASTDKKYSVIYMHDAQNLFDTKTSYVGEWSVDEKLDSLKAPVIVVGIEHGNDKRIDELTPFKNEKYGGGNADNYLDFIVKTLKPYIDKNYKTTTKAKNTTIMGSSLGGLVSYYAILKYPEVFGKAGVFSPSFWFSNDIYTLTEQAPKNKTKIYFLCGDKESDDMVKEMKKMETLLDRNRCYCLHLTKEKIVKGGEHNEKLWRDGFVGAILWLGY
ncbi:Predicted hydrolase of the alpha/beta superfamily [Flavobacterium aquidurense]|uniref:Alpha-mannosidase n=2 Tax=Flavobacterium frigidimaris TaxID=262320 RepID=A0ABX4BLQ1_FLAFR|nr:alpha-mannosidase [Flavobacterium frigidimaris]SDY21608.1 Predicted hydrolase of the alpha/beta superfamily [Flavobacterium aquidurense]